MIKYYGWLLKMANMMVSGVISLTLGVIMVTTVLIPTVKGVNTSAWSTSEIAIFGLITLGSLIGVGYGAFTIFGLA